MIRHARLAVLFAMTATGIASCNYTPDSTPPPPPPVVVFTGALYVQGGRSTDVSFNVTAETAQSPQKTGSFTIGKDSGQFTVNASDPMDYTINGRSLRPSCAGCSNTIEVLRFGIHVLPSEITGASPSLKDGLQWEIQKTVSTNNGTEFYKGNIKTNTGAISVNFSASEQGKIEGEVSIDGTTIILNGYLDSESATIMPKGAVGAMLVICALHTRS